MAYSPKSTRRLPATPPKAKSPFAGANDDNWRLPYWGSVAAIPAAYLMLSFLVGILPFPLLWVWLIAVPGAACAGLLVYRRLSMSSSYSWMQTFIACSLGFGSLLVWSSLSLLFRAVGLMDFGFSEAAELATDEGLVWMAGALLGVLFAQFLIGFAAISALERALD